MNRLQVLGLTAVAVFSLGAAGCRKKADAKEGAKEQDLAIRVETAKIGRGEIEATLKQSTHLEAEEEVKVFARTANRITELLVEEGDDVEKGALLLRLDDDIQKTAFDKAEVRHEKAKQEFERQRKLYEQNLISEQVFKDTQFEFKQAELALDDAKRELEYTQVRAPIAGKVTRRMVKLGELVNVNHHLFDIVDFESIVARIYLPDKALQILKVGLPARVTPDSMKETEFEGFVKRVSPIVESKSGTVKVTVGFKEPKHLRPGLFVNVELVTSKRNDALLISKRALVYDGELTYVFRLLDGRKVERVLVEPRVIDALNVEPAAGFAEGDEIVIAGQTGLKDGAKVRLPGDTVATDVKTNATVKVEASVGNKS